MKLAYTTLGCPDWNLDQIIKNTREYGIDGVDFRGYMNELDITKFPDFSTHAAETAKRFAGAGLEVPCFSTGINVNGNDQKRRDNLDETRRYAKLCRIFCAKFLRIFGGQEDPSPREQAIERFVTNIQPLLKVAGDYGTVLLLETHDTWTESGKINEVMERVNSPSLRVLWDIHHPWKASNETLDYTWDTLGKWVSYTHWKDATAENKLCLMGKGALPLREWYRLLKSNGYDGYCTLEWEKVWFRELEEPEIAFPDFSRYMRKFEQE